MFIIFQIMYCKKRDQIFYTIQRDQFHLMINYSTEYIHLDLVDKINAVCKLLGFQFIKLHNARLKIAVVIHSNTFMLANLTYNKFKCIIKEIRTENKIITLDKQMVDEE